MKVPAAEAAGIEMKRGSRMNIPFLAVAPAPASRRPAPAGVTHDGSRDLALSPADLESALSIPDRTGLVSLGLSGGSELRAPEAPQLLLRHCNASVQLGGRCMGGPGAPLDATFRLAAPRAGCEDEAGEAAAAAACSQAAARARRLLMQKAAGAAEGATALPRQQQGGFPQLVSIEAASLPSHYLTALSGTSELALLPAQRTTTSGGGMRGSAVAQTFLLHLAGDGGAGQPAFALEPLSQPGARVALTDDMRLRVQVGAWPAYPACPVRRVGTGRSRVGTLV